MTWKSSFAGRVRLADLDTIGPFKLSEAPEPLGKGKYRVTLHLKSGGRRMLTTYESTIGDMILAGKDWIEAVKVKVGDAEYTNFRAVK